MQRKIPGESGQQQICQKLSLTEQGANSKALIAVPHSVNNKNYKILFHWSHAVRRLLEEKTGL